MKITLILLTFLFCGSIYANENLCSKLRGAEFYGNISYDLKQANLFTLERKNLEEAIFTLGGCKQYRNSLIRFSHTLKYLEETGEVITAFPDMDDLETKSRCSLKNASQFPYNQTKSKDFFKDLKKSIQNKFKITSSCVIGTIKDFGADLKWPENQSKCHIKSIDKRTAQFKGTDCFFKNQSRSIFQVSYKLDQACANENFLVRNNLQPQDVDADTVISYVDTVKADVTHKVASTIAMDLHFEAPKRILAKAESYADHLPSYLSTWTTPNLHIADVKMIGLEEYTSLKIPLLINNNCPKKCSGKLCVSPCNYKLPMAIFGEVFKLENNKKKFISDWYHGGVIPANWQGLTTDFGTSFEVANGEFKVGDKLRIELTLDDPKVDYMMLEDSFQKFINSMELNDMIDFNLDGGTIPSIGSFNSIPNLPSIESIQALKNGSKEMVELLKEGLKGMTRLSSASSIWPPYYDKICTQKGKCIKKLSNHTKYAIEFTIASVDEDENVKIKGLKIARKSKILNSYLHNANQNKMPHISCGDE
jgi:hypothetical protein